MDMYVVMETYTCFDIDLEKNPYDFPISNKIAISIRYYSSLS